MDIELNRQFSNKEIQLTNKYFKHVKLPYPSKKYKLNYLRFHLIPVRMAEIKQQQN